MRITGGRLRGRRLALFKGLDIRPTSDRVREAVFDLLGHDLSGERVLDLFAGTGSLGLEAISRGAAWAVFIDRSLKAVELIRKNLKLCGVEAQGFVLKKDLLRGLPRRDLLPEGKADLVFLDPPYRKGMIPAVLEELVARRSLASPSILVGQSEQKEVLPPRLKTLQIVTSRTYGDTRITLYRHEGQE